MGDHGIRSNHAAHAGGGGPKRQVSVLPVDEEPRIESAELSPESWLGTNSRQPVTMSTSRTESRFQPPSDSGSKRRVPLKTLESAVAKQKRLQRWARPSTIPGRGGCPAAASCRRNTPRRLLGEDQEASSSSGGTSVRG